MTRRPSRFSKRVLCFVVCLCCLTAPTGRSSVWIENGSIFFGSPESSVGTGGGPFTVKRGGFFAGFGEFEANVHNRGTTEPGFVPFRGSSGSSSLWSSRNPIGTLGVKGHFFQTPSGTLAVDVKSPENHDLLVVKGIANLSGTLRVDSLGYRPRAGDRIPILRAERIVGKFTRIRTSLPGRFEVEFEKVGGLGFLVIVEKSSPKPPPVPLPLSPRGIRW